MLAFFKNNKIVKQEIKNAGEAHCDKVADDDIPAGEFLDDKQEAEAEKEDSGAGEIESKEAPEETDCPAV